MKQDIICRSPLTEEVLSEALGTFFRQIRPHRERMFAYYRGEQPVPKGPAVRGRPNNLLRVPFPRYITEVHTGYFLGLPPTLALGRPEEGRTFEDLSAAVHLDHLLFDVGRDISICGAGFEMVTGLVDAYNLLLSGAMDDMQSVANAFLALYGMQGTTQGDIEEANRTRVLSLAEGGRAEFVVKNLNHEALAQLEGNLRRSILQLSMTPDLSDEGFAGNASGVALQYKLWGVEQVRSAKERSFTEGMYKLLRAFSGALAVLGRPAALETGQLTFYKNMPQNHTELAQTLLDLSPVLSRRTILKNLPWVTDPEEELRQKTAEAAAENGF